MYDLTSKKCIPYYLGYRLLPGKEMPRKDLEYDKKIRIMRSVPLGNALLGQILGGSVLSSIDVCANGTLGSGSPEGCSAYITQTFQDAISTP